MSNTFTILLHCELKSEGVSSSSITVGVSSTDSLLAVKNALLKKIPMLPSDKAWIFQLCSGEFLFDSHSTTEFLSSKFINEFVSITSPSASSIVHLSLVFNQSLTLVTHITTPLIQNCDPDGALDNPAPVTPEIHGENPNYENTDAELLKLIYKLVIFFALVPSEADILNIFTVVIISSLLILNYFKLLNFSVTTSARTDLSPFYRFLYNVKNDIAIFILSAFPTIQIKPQ